MDVVDYLLKPISLERFLRAIGKMMQTEDIGFVAEKRLPTNQEEFLYFQADRKMVRVLIPDLLYVESLKDYVRIYTTTAAPLLVKRTIASVETLLPDGRFLRIHRSFLVALDKITAYTAAHVYLSNQELPIGRLYNRQVLQMLESLPLAK